MVSTHTSSHPVPQARGGYATADAVYQQGINVLAAPVERLRAKYAEFQQRMVRAGGGGDLCLLDCLTGRGLLEEARPACGRWRLVVGRWQLRLLVGASCPEAGPLPSCLPASQPCSALPALALCRPAASSAKQRSRAWARPPRPSNPSASRWAGWAGGGRVLLRVALAAQAACWAALPASSARRPLTRRTAMLAGAAGWTFLWMTSLQPVAAPLHRHPLRSCSPAGAGSGQVVHEVAAVLTAIP